MTPNFAELDRVLEFIEENPDKHRQGLWGTTHAPCGTAACFAGWTTLMNGHTITGEDYFLNEDGDSVSAAAVAQTILGLTTSQAGALFTGDNSRKDIRRIIERWKKDYGYAEPKPAEPVTIDIDELLGEASQDVVMAHE